MVEENRNNDAASVSITEDEAAIYDRQIRLWGLEAQQKMRNATILIARLRGVATETIKNIVLAGIGKLIVIDDEVVSSADLGAGFFFRDEDVGKKRVEVAKSRIESLNPLVTIEAIPSFEPLSLQQLEDTVRGVDLICAADADRDLMIRINDACRAQNKPFYSGGSYGLIGYIFCDLISHEYLAPDHSNPKDPDKRIRKTLTYCTLTSALKPYSWRSLTRAQTRDLNPAAVFAVLSLWEYQARHEGQLPSSTDNLPEYEGIASSLFAQAEVNARVLKAMPIDTLEMVVTTASHEISPVCAVVGGMLAQDILKALAAQELPIANFFVFDGTVCHGSVCRMNM